jgi:glycine cleavage system H protein
LYNPTDPPGPELLPSVGATNTGPSKKRQEQDMDPEKLKYSSSHEWVHVDGDVVTVGITDYAAQKLSDLVYLDLPEVGDTVTAGKPFGEVESVKAVSDLNSPVSGEVTEVNSELPDYLERITDSPFEEGWMVKITMSNKAELDKLLSQEDYRKLCEKEEE